jgi:hypothetical protein
MVIEEDTHVSISSQFPLSINSIEIEMKVYGDASPGRSESGGE